MVDYFTILKDKDIIIISPEAWGECFVSKHHYALELSKKNKVWFIEPISIKWRIRNFFTIPIIINKVEKKEIYVIKYSNPVPRLNRFPYILQRLIFAIIISKIKKKLSLKDDSLIIWNFDLSRFINLKDWKSKYSIAHVVEYLNHPRFVMNYKFRYNMINSADLILCISNTIKLDVDKITRNRKSFFINHGVHPSDHIEKKKRVSLPGKNKIKSVFVGNFQISFNFDLLEKLSLKFSWVDFIMIGPIYDSNLGKGMNNINNKIEYLKNNKNIFFIGAVKYDSLILYIESADINLILYDKKYSNFHCNPHKIMLYFYSGNVTVSHYIDEYKNKTDILFMCDNDDEFISCMNNILYDIDKYNSKEKITARREYALSNSYNNNCLKIDRLLLQIKK